MNWARRQRSLIRLVAASGLAASWCAGAFVAPRLAADPATVVVRATAADLTVLLQPPGGVNVLAVFPRRGYLLAEVDGAGREALARAGFHVEEDPRQTARLRHPPLAFVGQSGGIPGFPCYRTVEESLARGAELAAEYPALATWSDIGDSWERTLDPQAGYDVEVLELTQSAIPGPKPKLFVLAALHAREYATAEIATRFAERLLAGYGSDPEITWLLDATEVHILLQANPDGRKRAESGLSWRKNANNLYCPDTEQRGADLNRNFSFEWGCCGGSSTDPCAPSYRGAGAASEPEIDAVESYLRQIFPDQRDPGLGSPAPDTATGLVLDLHSPGEDVLGSWGFTTDPLPSPNDVELRTLGRKIAFYADYFPFQGSFGLVDGSTKDFAYGELGVPGYTIEAGVDFFESCAFFESVVGPDNLATLLAIAHHAREPYRTPAGPDAVDLAVPTAPVAPGALITVAASFDDSRFATSNGSEPSQAISAAEVFVDLPPWQAGAVAFPLAAADGAFDTPVERAGATISTSGLGTGRHWLFFRGTDADGHQGALAAAFLDVLEPGAVPHLAGFVRDRASRLPLAATVKAGRFSTASDDLNGAFNITLPAGSYDVEVSAPGYAAERFSFQASGAATTRRTFFLDALATVAASDAEAGPDGWTAEAPWAASDEVAFSGQRSWSDSPGGFYGNDTDASLVSPILDLAGHHGTVLRFRQLYDISRGFDLAQVETSIDGGASWQLARAFTGEGHDTSWEAVELALPQLDDAGAARLRFRLLTDSIATRDGWHLDDIELLSAPRGSLLFADGFESGDVSAWSQATGTR